MHAMIHASLCSGIGGFDLAAEWAGYENLFHCEINEFARQVLSYHFPNTKCHEDLKTTYFGSYRGKVDVLSAGFPCQPFSQAGKRRGADDDRYLWDQVLRVVREVRPTWVIGENVNGITNMVQPGEIVGMEVETSVSGESREVYTAEHEYVIETICSDLEKEGYSVQPIVIPACAVGAPHRRDRVWFLARIRETATDPDGGSDGGIPRGHEKKSREERVQERGEIWKSNESGRLFGDASDPRGERCDIGECCGKERHIHNDGIGISSENKSEWDKRLSGLGEVCSVKSTPDPRVEGLERDFHSGEQISQGIVPGPRTHAPGCNFVHPTTDTDSLRQQKWFDSILTETPIREQSKGRDTWDSTGNRPLQAWAKFPTQPPLHVGDDGIPRQLFGLPLSDSKWRVKAVEACGNAIVPQIAYILFEAIKAIEEQQKK